MSFDAVVKRRSMTSGLRNRSMSAKATRKNETVANYRHGKLHCCITSGLLIKPLVDGPGTA